MLSLVFDNRFVRELPADPLSDNRRRQVLRACYSRVAATPVARPELCAYSREVAELVGLSPAQCKSPEFAEVFAGNRQLPGMDGYAACYGGHQFGSWAGQLGDGRAIVLGEALGPGGRLELQLKGAGPTPYSRTADGRAVMRSSVREFLCSEAMHHLGVPTTRALSLVATGEQVVRDMFYDGRPALEPGAVVCRVAPSFLRFGSYELPASRGDEDTLRALADYTLRHHFAHLPGALHTPGPSTYAAWLAEVCERTAAMVVEWMRVGFVHGVMNTDNMSILGLTIDYGPYGFIDDYDPDFTPNTTDAQGRRYRFANQPRVAFWNLVQLANAMVPLAGAPEPLEEALGTYPQALERGMQAMLAKKLGLTTPLSSEPDRGLGEDLLALLSAVETDMTIFFRALCDVSLDRALQASDAELVAPLAEAYYAEPPAEIEQRTAAWLRRYAQRVAADGLPRDARRARMLETNPRYILRNYIAQLAIDDAERGDYARVRELLEVMRRPYDEQPGRAELAGKRPDWARHRPGCSMLSCSS